MRFQNTSSRPWSDLSSCFKFKLWIIWTLQLLSFRCLQLKCDFDIFLWIDQPISAGYHIIISYRKDELTVKLQRPLIQIYDLSSQESNDWPLIRHSLTKMTNNYEIKPSGKPSWSIHICRIKQNLTEKIWPKI